MNTGTLVVALVHGVFFDAEGPARLVRQLCRAREAGADLAALPELPLNAWAPASRTVRDADAEPPGGPRHRAMASAAREADLAVLGGVIHRDPESGRRLNRALLFDRDGRLVAHYDKLHLPAEDGFWETDHYEPGSTPPRPIDGFGLRLGIQICSDVNRPEGSHLLGAGGAEVILAPRATPAASYERWLLAFRANAITSGTYVVSVNRPDSEPGVDTGGPSVVVCPDGRVLLEGEEPVALARLERAEVELARREYPGYLPVRTDLYARGWASLGPPVCEPPRRNEGPR